MAKRMGITMALSLALALTTGCASNTVNTNEPGSLLVEFPTEARVNIDGVGAGTTNEWIGEVEPGSATVSIGDAAAPDWTGGVVVTPGGETIVEPPAPQEPEPETPLPATPVPAPEQPAPAPTIPAFDYAASLTADFESRDKLPQTTVPEDQWYKYGTYGPPAYRYPRVYAPAGANAIGWQRDRVIEVAKKYLGIPYRHKHIPMLGLDCSNYTAWVYNYGLGIKFTSSISGQSATVGRVVGESEALEKGDLLFFKDTTGKVNHAGICINETTMIDESSVNANGVMIKPFTRTRKSYAYARRVIE